MKGHLKKNISASSSGFAVMSVLITRAFEASGKKKRKQFSAHLIPVKHI